MTKMRNIGRIAAAAALVACSVHNAAYAQQSTVVFAGADVRNQSYYGYIGGVHHFSGDFVSDGFLLRADALYGQYNYRSTAVLGGNVDGKVVSFDAMAGYQKALKGVFLRGFVGLDFEDHDLSPGNPFDSNQGSDVGVKVQGEVETDFHTPYYASFVASYGTAKDRYWTRARGGYNFSGVIVGPEALATGNGESSEQRIGAFVMLTRLGPVWLSASTGYSNMDNNHGGASAYGTFELSTSF
jgi:hypothetical protein